MVDISVRDLLDCVSAPDDEDLSILFHLFGFRRARVPADPLGVPASVSVAQLAEDIGGDHIRLNVIAMGLDGLGAGEDAALEEVDYCVFRIRNIYRPRLGVGRVLHYEVDAADADGFDVIADDDEAQDLWRSWSVGNSGIDAFVVRSISGTLLGRSPTPGSCTSSKRDGLLAGGVDESSDGISRTFAHEVGHFLDLDHNHNELPDGPCPATTAGRNNLMAQTGCAISVRTSVILTAAQGAEMRDHCKVRGGCS